DAAVKVSTSANASEGHFDVVVTDLARAQVTASTGTAPDADTTVVADGGTIDIGGVTVTISGGVTMNGLASAINGTANIGVKASVIATAPNTYRLVLTGKATGAASAFTVTNNMTLTSGTALQFSATNAVTASNAKITINNIQAESATNVFDNVAPGVTLTVSKAAPATTVSVDIAADSSALRTKVGAFVSAFNEFVKFTNDQQTSAGKGDGASLGRDPMLRQIRNQIRNVMLGQHGTLAAGTMTRLSESGIEFMADGTLKVSESKFKTAVETSPDQVAALFAGATGLFQKVSDTLDEYQGSDGFISGARERMSKQVAALDGQISNMQARLAIQRTALQKEFIAADAAMSQLKSQSNGLSSFGSGLGGF